MASVKKPILRKQHAAEVCNVCEACSDPVGSDALAHKKHEEKGGSSER